MFNLSGPELLIILLIVVLLFGVGRLSRIGGELGKGIREFRRGLRGDEDRETSPDKPKDAAPPPNNG